MYSMLSGSLILSLPSSLIDPIDFKRNRLSAIAYYHNFLRHIVQRNLNTSSREALPPQHSTRDVLNLFGLVVKPF